MARFDVAEWQAVQIRGTFFAPSTATMPGAAQPDWWERVVGQPPETRMQRPQTLGWEDSAPFETGRLTLRVEIGRIDWLWSAVDSPTPTFDYVGPYVAASERFSRLLSNFVGLENLPPVHRLAYGSVVGKDVADVHTGYVQLQDYLPSVRLDPDGSSDFLLQINRPRISRVTETLKINRLMRWSVGSVRFVPMIAGSGAEPVTLAAHVRAELDINTAPDATGAVVLAPASLPQLLDEVRAFATEILAEGDVP